MLGNTGCAIEPLTMITKSTPLGRYTLEYTSTPWKRPNSPTSVVTFALLTPASK